MRAKSARETKARKAILMADAEASVKMLSCDSLILFVNGIAEDDDDIRRYAIICSKPPPSFVNFSLKETL